MNNEKQTQNKHIIVNRIRSGLKYVVVSNEYFTTLNKEG